MANRKAGAVTVIARRWAGCGSLVLAAGIGFVLPACEPADRHAGTLARDSVGVRLVDFAWEAPDGQLLLAQEPVVLAGGVLEGAGGDVLFGIADVVGMADGSVLAAESSSQQVLVIAPDGRSQQRMGGRGGGPSEFTGLSQVFPLEDGGIGAFDRARRRFVAFTASGTLLRERALPQALAGSVDRLAVLQDGSLVLAAIGTFSAEGHDTGPYRAASPILHVGDTVQTMVQVPGLEVFSNDAVTGSVLYGATSIIAGARQGVWVADTKHPEVRLLTPERRAAAVVRWTERGDRTVTRRTREDLWQVIGDAAPPGERAQVEKLKDLMPFADTMPAFGSLIVGTNGWLWIGSRVGPEQALFDLPWPPQEWRVVDLQQGVVHAARTPAGFRLFDAGADHVLGVHQDEMGVERIVRYALTLAPEDG